MCFNETIIDTFFDLLLTKGGYALALFKVKDNGNNGIRARYIDGSCRDLRYDRNKKHGRKEHR